MTHKIVTLDVREDFRSGQHPCDKIQGALSEVGRGEVLRLLVPFEPVPLFEVARSNGLSHEARQMDAGDWEVLFSRRSGAEENTAQPVAHLTDSCGCGCSTTELAEIVDLDARGLEPPQPMVKILEALTALPAGSALRARTDRRPVHLYPMLEARGFAGDSEPQSDGSYVTHIRRA